MALRRQARAPNARRQSGPLSVEDGWAPITGRNLTDTPPTAFRTRWVAALVCLVLLVAILSLA